MSLAVVRRVLALLAMLAALLTLSFGMLLVTWRSSLAVLAVLGSAFLIWTAIKAPNLVARHALLVSVAVVVLAVLPLDVRLARTGHPGVRIVRLRYGYPTSETIAQAKAGNVELAGCIMPIFPALYVVRIAW
jgi:hypothetical protein